MTLSNKKVVPIVFLQQFTSDHILINCVRIKDCREKSAKQH